MSTINKYFKLLDSGFNLYNYFSLKLRVETTQYILEMSSVYFKSFMYVYIRSFKAITSKTYSEQHNFALLSIHELTN